MFALSLYAAALNINLIHRAISKSNAAEISKTLRMLNIQAPSPITALLFFDPRIQNLQLQPERVHLAEGVALVVALLDMPEAFEADICLPARPAFVSQAVQALVV